MADDDLFLWSGFPSAIHTQPLTFNDKVKGGRVKLTEYGEKCLVNTIDNFNKTCIYFVARILLDKNPSFVVVFWTRKRVPNGHERCCCCCCWGCCYQIFQVLGPKAFSFQNRSPSNFAYTLLTIFSRIAPCRIFIFSPN